MTVIDKKQNIVRGGLFPANRSFQSLERQPFKIKPDIKVYERHQIAAAACGAIYPALLFANLSSELLRLLPGKRERRMRIFIFWMTINLDARGGLKYYGELCRLGEITEGETEVEAALSLVRRWRLESAVTCSPASVHLKHT